MHGAGNAYEIELMGRVLTPEAALAAGTREAARMLGLDSEVGTLEAGKFADLIGVCGDPRRDPSVLRRVEFVMRGGQVVRSNANADRR